jgi:HSP20 family protein
MRLHCRYIAHGAGPHMLEQIQQMHQLMHQLMVRATPGIAGIWQPPTDVYETEEALVVQAELAGVREEDIDVALFSDYLAISGQRRPAVPPGAAAYHLAGILYGEFRLEVAVLGNIRRDDVEASYDNGMLTVVLPKAAERIEPSAVSRRGTAAGESRGLIAQRRNHGD